MLHAMQLVTLLYVDFSIRLPNLEVLEAVVTPHNKAPIYHGEIEHEYQYCSEAWDPEF